MIYSFAAKITLIGCYIYIVCYRPSRRGVGLLGSEELRGETVIPGSFLGQVTRSKLLRVRGRGRWEEAGLCTCSGV